MQKNNMSFLKNLTTVADARTENRQSFKLGSEWKK